MQKERRGSQRKNLDSLKSEIPSFPAFCLSFIFFNRKTLISFFKHKKHYI